MQNIIFFMIGWYYASFLFGNIFCCVLGDYRGFSKKESILMVLYIIIVQQLVKLLSSSILVKLNTNAV